MWEWLVPLKTQFVSFSKPPHYACHVIFYFLISILHCLIKGFCFLWEWLIHKHYFSDWLPDIKWTIYRYRNVLGNAITFLAYRVEDHSMSFTLNWITKLECVCYFALYVVDILQHFTFHQVYCFCIKNCCYGCSPWEEEPGLSGDWLSGMGCNGGEEGVGGGGLGQGGWCSGLLSWSLELNSTSPTLGSHTWIRCSSCMFPWNFPFPLS